MRDKTGTKFSKLISVIRWANYLVNICPFRAMNICPGGVETNFALDDARGRTKGSKQLAGMMRPEDVAELIYFVISRPRSFRILETALRPVQEAQWG